MISEIDYQGWQALQLKTGKAELVVPTGVGPRVLRLGFSGQDNLFHNVAGTLGQTGGDKWNLYGGHRLWHAPEHPQRTYVPDNKAVQVQKDGEKTIVLTGQPEAPTGMTKTVQIEALTDTTFRVHHTLKYEGLWPVETACWCLSVMEYGGYGVIPLVPKGEHPKNLLPGYSLITWPYTDYSHPVWDFHSGFIGVDSPKATVPQKLGISNYPGWSAYWQPGGTFVKAAVLDPELAYPDDGSAFELFSCDFMTELETLSPLSLLEPGDELHHTEYWALFEGFNRPDTDEVYAKELKPAVESWLKDLAL